MNRILAVAKTEILEHRRQPAMLFILLFNYVFWGGIFLFGLSLLATAINSPVMMEQLTQKASAFGVCNGQNAVHALLKTFSSTFGALLFTNLPLFVAIMCGYSVLHDREKGVLPFLMLAPLSRRQLLMGKLLGAMAVPAFLQVISIGFVSLLARQFSIMAPFSASFGGSAAWWAALLLSGPAASVLVGSLGTVISAMSRDVRTSMQYTSFFIGILSLGIGFVLFDALPYGAAWQLLFSAVCGIVGLIILEVGSHIISRDIRA